MMTLSIDVSAMPRRGKNAALLSPCHTQISLPAAFYGRRRSRGVIVKSLWLWTIEFNVLDLFYRAAMFAS
jgi:hypothetical protein